MGMKKGNNARISYEPEADVLMWEVGKRGQIDFAEETGNVVVHFTKKGTPVLVEILEASKFLAVANGLLGKGKIILEKRHPVAVR